MKLNFELKSKFKKFMTRKHAKLILAIAAIFIVLIGLFGTKSLLGSKTKVVQNTAVVKKGNLNITVTGSGSIYSSNESKLYSQIGATVTKVNYKEGDVVKAGDVIVEFDDSDYQTSLSNTLNNLEQSQLSAQSSYDDANNLTIRSPFAGQVSGITVKQGDTVQSGGTLLTISDPSKLKVVLTFNAKDAENIQTGQYADVYLTSMMQSIAGTVTYVSNKAAATSSGGLLYTVEIRMDNPGAVTEGAYASADISTNAGTVTSTNTAAVSYVQKKAVTTTTGGTVKSISVNENQDVSSGAVLITLSNDSVTRSKTTAALKVAASQSQLSSSLKQASRYKIVAPYDGTITTINYKVGDTVKAGDEVADISNPDEMQFDVNVDELDIASLAVGQKVNITLDAISSTDTTPMQGEVIKVAFTGTSSNGVTTYPVTIKFDGDVTALKSGMNANAEIIVDSLKNVLYVPIEAVTTSGTKSTVWLKGGTASASSNWSNNNGSTSNRTNTNGSSSRPSSTGSSTTASSSSKTNYYAGAARTEVKIGEHTDSYIVIKSGLKEGDIVVLPQTTSSSSSSSARTSTRTGVGGMGGPGGGM